ncbi:MAG: hypothetical protein V2A74_11880 [bacterium]
MPGNIADPNPAPRAPEDSGGAPEPTGPRITYGEILIGVVVLGLLLLLFTHNLKLLYNPMMFLLLIVIIGQYLIQKGVDRSRIYQMQLQQLQAKREEDLAFLRDVEREIYEIHKLLDGAKENPSPQKTLAEAERRLAQIYARFRTRT